MILIEKRILISTICFLLCLNGFSQATNTSSTIAEKPPMGWNSFDSYGVYLHEQAAIANIDAFAEKLQPHGYEYFVIDAGWFGEFKLRPGTLYPAEHHAEKLHINKYGLLQPSNTYFPNGLKEIINRCHSKGIKFGLHLMRGIPRQAVHENTPIKGTSYRAADIADKVNVCGWNKQNFGVDMDKPGAQEFYNSLINQMAAWGVDFIKYDDIVPFPREIEAVAKAIAQCGRPIVLSLSPGNRVDEDEISSFKKANMLRVTGDIWDDQHGIDLCFNAWRKWQGKEEPGFWIDMDMITFGQLLMMSPMPEGVKRTESRGELFKKINSGELQNVELLAGKGWNRWSELNKNQMYTFITLRALSACPLMMGGDLPSLDEFSLSLITNEEVLSCNQNGIMGSLKYEQNDIELWATPKKNSSDVWVGIFNRTDALIDVDAMELLDKAGVKTNGKTVKSIWTDNSLRSGVIQIGSNGVIFIKVS